MRVSAQGLLPCLRHLAVGLPVLLASCAGLESNDQGLLQPQTVRGPCQVQKFYIVGGRAVPVEMTVGNDGTACSVTIFNPDLEIVLDAGIVTTPPAHGSATASVVTLGHQAAFSYTPQPGYRGPDRFEVTLEPNALSVTVRVMVQPNPPTA